MTQSRLDFERWAGLRGYDLRRWLRDEYYSSDTQKVWIGWAARDSEILALSAKLAADKGE